MKTTTAAISRRDLLRMGMAGAAVGMVSLAGTSISALDVGAEDQEAVEQVSGPGAAVAKIYELQAAFHRAKTTQNINLMMSLWAENGTLHVQGDPKSPYIGSSSLRAFWQTSGSFTHRRLSLVPSFKTQINVRGASAWLYFECHDVGDFDLATRFIAADTFLGGTVRRAEDSWVFSNMTAGKAFPLSIDHHYFP